MVYIKKKKKIIVLEPTVIIRKYGYEYHLVQVERGESRCTYNDLSEPCFMGRYGYALKYCKKIKLK